LKRDQKAEENTTLIISVNATIIWRFRQRFFWLTFCPTKKYLKKNVGRFDRIELKKQKKKNVERVKHDLVIDI